MNVYGVMKNKTTTWGLEAYYFFKQSIFSKGKFLHIEVNLLHFDGGGRLFRPENSTILSDGSAVE